jgi:rhodanese-related sulfurtransferase
MRWKQFLTPVESVDSGQAKAMMAKTGTGDMTILDVRQPSEYNAGHIPGATLIPLPQLGDRLQELDREKPLMVY